MFSSKEAEKLVEVVTCLFLDRRLQGLSVILYECMHSAISYFTDQEWNTSCEKIAKSLACRWLPFTIRFYAIWKIGIVFVVLFTLKFNTIILISCPWQGSMNLDQTEMSTNCNVYFFILYDKMLNTLAIVSIDYLSSLLKLSNRSFIYL